jgi:hypothetical protein
VGFCCWAVPRDFISGVIVGNLIHTSNMAFVSLHCANSSIHCIILAHCYSRLYDMSFCHHFWKFLGEMDRSVPEISGCLCIYMKSLNDEHTSP